MELYIQNTTIEYKKLIVNLDRFSGLLCLCKQLREQVMPLVDAWGLPDFVIKAPSGRYDGDIYTAYFDVVRSAPNCIGVQNIG
ncbi:10465_t:CDS:2 [Entrophospora sp. SA101]|nr:10465_t:CDS:2 [Entrophospora sp. SA101]CAJ0832757.1 6127_t:CDS:2 [Entrophospora sp. SA101]CAJ0863403.1 836_t:CDS:2 [Entrophospora sp. SA101]CAJ0869416.1 1465_t:CDS:2 [Entrophospora sp. SA101]